MIGGEYEFDVTLSFAGEDRATAERFAELLKAKGFSVFYDNWNNADLWGADLFQRLDEVYAKKSRFCVMFISAAYRAKAWTNHELRSAQARAFQQNGAYILPVRIDDTDIPGVRPTLGYMDLRQQSIEQLAEIAARKISAAKFQSTAVEEGSPQRPSSPAAADAPPARTGTLGAKRRFTDQERDAYLDDAFGVVAKYFENTLAGLAAGTPGFIGKFRSVSASHFTALIYRDGKNVAQGGIRLGGLGRGFTSQIIYSNDPSATNSMNEGVSVADDGGEMFLKSSGLSRLNVRQQKDRLTPYEAAELFWGILTWPLQG